MYLKNYQLALSEAPQIKLKLFNNLTQFASYIDPEKPNYLNIIIYSLNIISLPNKLMTNPSCSHIHRLSATFQINIGNKNITLHLDTPNILLE